MKKIYCVIDEKVYEKNDALPKGYYIKGFNSGRKINKLVKEKLRDEGVVSIPEYALISAKVYIKGDVLPDNVYISTWDDFAPSLKQMIKRACNTKRSDELQAINTTAQHISNNLIYRISSQKKDEKKAAKKAKKRTKLEIEFTPERDCIRCGDTSDDGQVCSYCKHVIRDDD